MDTNCRQKVTVSEWVSNFAIKIESGITQTIVICGQSGNLIRAKITRRSNTSAHNGESIADNDNADKTFPNIGVER